MLSSDTLFLYMYILSTVHTHSANGTSRDSLIALRKNMNSLNLSLFQKQSCCSCRYGLSKQDVLSFSSSQQPGPPTQTVYLRLKLDLCNYTSYNQHPRHILAAPLGSFMRVPLFFFFPAQFAFNGFGLLFLGTCLSSSDQRQVGIVSPVSFKSTYQ